jgi:hypothetical protein
LGHSVEAPDSGRRRSTTGQNSLGGHGMRRRIIESVTVALLLAVLGAAVSTYIEVRMLRHDVDRIEGIIDNLVEEQK